MGANGEKGSTDNRGGHGSQLDLGSPLVCKVGYRDNGVVSFHRVSKLLEEFDETCRGVSKRFVPYDIESR